MKFLQTGGGTGRGAALVVLVAMIAGTGGAGMPPEANRMRPDHAPTPFHAADIMDGCPAGAWRSTRLSVLGPQGWTVMRQMTRFLDSDTEGTEIELQETVGQAVRPPQRLRAAWEDLQRHASFPRADTRIEPVPVEIEAGRFDTWLYIVVTWDEGRLREKRLWFARGLPGPPVHMEEWLDHELVFRMTLVEHGRR